MLRSIIVGVGSYLPERVVTNEDMARIADTSDSWIVERTGIHKRHVAAKGERTSDLASKAAQNALAAAQMKPAEVDLIVLATATPDETFPATATRVQASLGCVGVPAFDVQAVCAGFVYALAVADNFIRAKQASAALVIGAETFSRIVDWSDRSTCILFGDGAGAVALRASDGVGDVKTDRGILNTQLCADGRQHHLLYVDGGPSTTGAVGYLRMEGRKVFRHAVEKLSEVATAGLDAVGLTVDDVDWIVPHQASRRIIEQMAYKLGALPERVVITVDRHANTSAASVPLALDAAIGDGRIKRGDLLLMAAMGGGLTWGSAMVRY